MKTPYLMLVNSFLWPFFWTLAAGCALGAGSEVPAGPGEVVPPLPAPPAPPPLPAPAVYQRGSLSPIYKLTPSAEFGRFTLFGVAMRNADFTSNATVVSAEQKLVEIGQQIARDRGQQQPIDLIPSFEDRTRAQQIPFRGNPSDVKFLEIDGQTKLYVPLGGDLMTPGNEVAAVTVGGGTPRRVKVGIRPQRVAVHPDGVVFVCNQFSNYLSVIDARTDQPLQGPSGPVEIPTELYCADIIITDRSIQAPDRDEQVLYVANQWRSSVLRYDIDLVRDPLGNRVVDVRVQRPAGAPENTNGSTPTAEITGVGNNPFRISLSEDRGHLYVANNRGGELARVSLADSRVTSRIALNAPTIDVVQIADSVLVPTTTPDRGLIAQDEPVKPLEIQAAPAIVTGIDGAQHEAHPGALFDRTRSYNFEDLRNGLFDVGFTLPPQAGAVYYTDDVSSEPNFSQAQKVLAGAVPQAIIRNRAGNRIYIAHSSSDLVQELEVRAGAFKVSAVPGATFETSERPFALALNEDRGELYVATWGGEVIEVFDTDSRALRSRIDLGYAQPAYPATTMERGEYFFYNAEWSNNGRKACSTCHTDELLTDGIGYANGATAPTAYHQVRPNYNQLTTDSYFWNGSFSNGSYASLAFAAQTRTNCELILFGLIEGPSSNPEDRVGDPNNRVTSGADRDALCRPRFSSPGQLLPDNFAEIQQIIAEQKQVRNQLIQEVTGFSNQEVSRFSDFYSASELRLPPNPLKFLHETQALSGADSAKIEEGRQLFTQTGCANCHDPGNPRHPFADGINHGSGADWAERFVNTYSSDPRITQVLGAIPDQMIDGIVSSPPDSEINIHLDPIDYFVPFCFDVNSCLMFEDPLAVRGNVVAETERLDAIVQINLADPERGFMPGAVRGQPVVNTPSLRGVWFQANLLRHGLAYSLAEAILGPGHPALREGETGFAISSLGQLDVHGQTSSLTPEQVEALLLYIESIE